MLMVIMIMTAAAMMTTMKVTMMTITTWTTMIMTTPMTMTLNNIFHVCTSWLFRVHTQMLTPTILPREICMGPSDSLAGRMLIMREKLTMLAMANSPSAMLMGSHSLQ